MTLDKNNGDIIVARDDALYYYGVDGRGPCYAYDGPKSLVAVYKDYIALGQNYTLELGQRQYLQMLNY